MERTSRRGVLIPALLLATVLAGCSSGGGPFNQPDASEARLLGTAAAWLGSSDRLSDGPVYVLDRIDPSVLGNMRDVPGLADQLLGTATPGALGDASRQALRDGFGAGRSVEFVDGPAEVPAGEAVTLNGDLHCTLFRDGGTRVAFATALGLTVHGDVYYVVAELADGCSTGSLALRLAWQPGELFGGRWEVTDTIDGPMISV